MTSQRQTCCCVSGGSDWLRPDVSWQKMVYEGHVRTHEVELSICDQQAQFQLERDLETFLYQGRTKADAATLTSHCPDYIKYSIHHCWRPKTQKPIWAKQKKRTHVLYDSTLLFCPRLTLLFFSANQTTEIWLDQPVNQWNRIEQPWWKSECNISTNEILTFENSSGI